MTFPWALLPLCFVAAISPPQHPAPSPAAGSDLSVLGQRWEKVYRNPALEEDPFAANDQQREDARQQQESVRRQRELEVSRRDGTRQQVIRVNKEAATPAANFPTIEMPGPQSPSTAYVYRAKVKNDGPKIVRAVVWEYVFADPETGEEVGRHRQKSVVRIRPGKNGEMAGRSPSPPARVVRAAEGEKGRGEVYAERVIVRRVEYEDGTAWQHP